MTGWSKQAQDGMTLIEVMVALVILGVGLLGGAAIQLKALKYTDSSLMTSQASFIAYDMLERIRANAGADYSVTPQASGSQLRDQDLSDFKRNITSFGGSIATGSITQAQGVFTIAIQWDDSRAAGAADSLRRFVLGSRAAVDPVVAQ